jgi:hypothetical protein
VSDGKMVCDLDFFSSKNHDIYCPVLPDNLTAVTLVKAEELCRKKFENKTESEDFSTKIKSSGESGPADAETVVVRNQEEFLGILYKQFNLVMQ